MIRNWLKELLAWIVTIAFAVLAARLITDYVIFKAWVPSGSMENTIQVNDKMIGFRLAYLFSEPKRGDIIIFIPPDAPEEYDGEKVEYYVKRVIGLPGETVEIKDGYVYINGEPLEEPYLKEKMKNETFGPYVVPEGEYFMMGDNRNDSHDSRYWKKSSFIKKEDIKAKVLFRYSPGFHWYSDIDYDK